MATAFQQPQAQFNYQFNNTTTLNNAPKEENSILIQNLDRFVTESMLHQKFSEVGEIKQITLKSNKLSGLSLGRALIEFKNENSVKEAVRKFNMRKFFESNEDVEQKFMEVTQKVNKTKLDEFKTQCKLFFKLNLDSEKDIINPTEISDYLTIFGDIQQLKFKSKKGKLLNYGSITFKSKEEKEKALASDSSKNASERGFTIQFDEYDSNQQNFNLHVVEHNLINQTIPDDILADKSKKDKERERLQDIIKKDLESKKIEYQSIFLVIDEGHKKPFFFISVKSRETFQQIQADFESHGATANIITNRKNPSDQYKNLHLKNLKVQELTEEEKTRAVEQFQKLNQNVQKDAKIIYQEQADAILKEKIQKDLEKLGFKDASIKITPPPHINKIQNAAGQTKDFQETRQGTLFFPSSEKGIQFMTTYLSKPNVDDIKTWFLNDNPQGRVNILLGQSDYDLYKRAKVRGAQEQYQIFQKSQVQQFMQQQLIEQGQQYNNLQINNDSYAAGNRYNQFNNNRSPNYSQQAFPNQQNSQYQNRRNLTDPTTQQRTYTPYPRNNTGGRFQNNQNQGGNYQGPRQYTNNSAGGIQNSSRPPYQGQRQYNNYNNQNQNQQIGQTNPGQFQGQQQQPHPQQQQQQQQQQQPRNPTNQNQAGNQPRPIQNTPIQINQNSIQQQSAQAPAVMTIDQIRENPDDFVKKPQDLQKSILGQLIYPKVKAKLDERKEDSKILTPKITGMLIDFSVFELEDIIEMIDNQEDLNERIEEALELIKNPTNQK